MVNERERILNFIVETIINTLEYSSIKDKISYDSNFVWDIGMNSIDFMRLINALEEEFDISYKVDGINIDETVDKVIENVISCLQELIIQ